MRARGPLLAVLLAALVIVVVVFASRTDRNDGPPLSPTSTAPDGAKAVIELLERFDTPVTIRDGMPPPGEQVALVVQRIGATPALEARVIEVFEDFARSGGRVVVATADSELAAEPVGSLDVDDVRLAGRCPLQLEGVERLTGLRAVFPALDGSFCFGRGDNAAVVVRRLGDGEIISVGGPDVFTNQYLDEQDNAVLATALLTGHGPVTFVRPGTPFNGDKGLLELLPRGVVVAMAQLVVAFGLFVWASARRLGRPVREPMLWALPGTAFADGMGQLLQRAGRPHLAARWLRRRARRQLARRYGLGDGAGAAEIAAAMTAGADATPANGPSTEAPDHAAVVTRTLQDGHVLDAQGLLELAERIDRLRHEVPQ